MASCVCTTKKIPIQYLFFDLMIDVHRFRYSRLRNKHRGTLTNFLFFSRGYILILSERFIKKSEILLFNEVGYVFSRGYVYCFSQMFQGATLIPESRVQTLKR